MQPTTLKAEADTIGRAWDDAIACADDLLQRSVDLVQESRQERPGRWRPFSIQHLSCNRKLAPQRIEIAKSRRRRFVPIGPYVASTYASISATCPRGCPFRNNGCYSQAGSQHLTMGRLDRAARGLRGIDVSLAEAEGLSSLWRRGVPRDGAKGGRDLRLHVGGDASCTRGARAVADAVEGLQARGLGAAWTYTHRWRTISREAWGPIRVLASVETVDDFSAAARRGYAPAFTVAAFGSTHPRRVRGIRMIPCPYSASPKKPSCATCRRATSGVPAKGSSSTPTETTLRWYEGAFG